MKIAAVLFVSFLSFNSFSQTRPVITEKIPAYMNRDEITFDQIIRIFEDYYSQDYEYLFNHQFQPENDIHLTTIFGHRILFTDVNNNSVIDMIGNSKTQDSLEVGYAEFRPGNVPIFEFIEDFPTVNLWPEKIVDLNNDNSNEIITGSDYPFVNVFSESGDLINSLPVRAQWGDQQPLIADIDGNNKIDFIIDQNLNGDYSINFFEYDYITDTLNLITKIDSLMTRFIIDGDTLDTLVNTSCCFSDFVYGDLDDDGLIEVASGGNSGHLNIFEKSSTGYKQVHFDNLRTFNMYQIAITNDLDSNGKKELIVMGNYDGGPLYWIEADSNDTYSLKRSAFIDYGPNISILSLEFYSTDVDLDGREDLVFIGGSNVWVLKWNLAESKWDVFFYLDENHDYENMWGNGYERFFPGLSVNVEFFDVDEDGDKDMFISTDEDITLFFESNLEAVGVDDTNSGNLPKQFDLLQNYPNPFNPVTTITYYVPKTSKVRITVYDVLGREISELVNEEKLSGTYEVKFNGINSSSGVYFYVMQADNFIDTKKLILLK